MTNSKETLKPCPFCGYAAILDDSCSDFTVLCSCCGASPRHSDLGEDQTKRLAIKAWNTRPIEDELVEALQRIVIIRQDSGGISKYDLVNSCVEIAQEALEKAGMITENK
jgi:Lar family restriction alleviation protein